MRLILVGCEYSGTTTLGHAINKWAAGVMGGSFAFHDHEKIPHIAGHGGEGGGKAIWFPDRHPDRPISALTDEEQDEFLALSPRIKEMFMRLSLAYHTPKTSAGLDYQVIGHHIDEAVYGPLYFGYGGEDDSVGGSRSVYARHIEERIMRVVPDTVLVLVKASPEVIARRMKEDPHLIGVVQEKDIEYVLQCFEEEYACSIIENKFTLDTSTATVEETLAEFVAKMEPYLTKDDRMRILAPRSLEVGP